MPKKNPSVPASPSLNKVFDIRFALDEWGEPSYTDTNTQTLFFVFFAIESLPKRAKFYFLTSNLNVIFDILIFIL